jgi:hypothetical protein
MDQHSLAAEFNSCREHRREERRRFLKMAGAATAVVGGSSLLIGCGDDDDDRPATPAPTPPAPTPEPANNDPAVLNFALNLEYLEAQFYSFATTGSGLPGDMLGGTGNAGQVVGGRQVQWADPLVRRYAEEIAKDERAHVEFLRGQLGNSAVAMPQIDIGTDPAGAFSAAARAAGLVGEGQAFDPYASDENFLLGAFLFEDVGVTAYKGAATLITNKTYLEAAAGILAVEAYHAGLIRTVLYRKGLTTPALIGAVGAISDARDSLDGGNDRDQGVVRSGEANIVPTDGDGIVFGRPAGRVLNIVYLNGMAGTTSGGFFPAGVNGTINASA